MSFPLYVFIGSDSNKWGVEIDRWLISAIPFLINNVGVSHFVVNDEPLEYYIQCHLDKFYSGNAVGKSVVEFVDKESFDLSCSCKGTVVIYDGQVVNFDTQIIRPEATIFSKIMKNKNPVIWYNPSTNEKAHWLNGAEQWLLKQK